MSELYNVLDKLREIAESGNDSEDVAAAIEQVESYTFKDRLKEAEDASIYNQGDVDDFFGGPDETTVGKQNKKSNDATDDVTETPGDDDQYCATCGNTGEDLSQSGVACPNGCGDEVGDEAGGAGGDAFDRIHDRVDARGGSGMDDLGDDPWGIGDGDVEEDTSQAGGSALDRVTDRSHRAGDGGPVDRVRGRHDERFAIIDEEMGKIFQTPMERHSWMMNELSRIAGDTDPEAAAMIKSLMKKAGEADVRGGNC